jgi:hypothetical protein
VRYAMLQGWLEENLTDERSYAMLQGWLEENLTDERSRLRRHSGKALTAIPVFPVATGSMGV